MEKQELRKIGLIGGMSPESTITYYRELNRLAAETLGREHSAPLLLVSVDFGVVRELQRRGDEDGERGLLTDAARRLEAAGAEVLLIGTNTKHKYADDVQAAVDIPLVHIVDAVAAELRKAGVGRPLLLGTLATTSEPFYLDRLRQKHGLEGVAPEPGDRERIDAIIFEELVHGALRTCSRDEIVGVVELVKERSGADGVILGCTELGLLLTQADFDLPAFDSTLIHARTAFAVAKGAFS